MIAVEGEVVAQPDGVAAEGLAVFAVGGEAGGMGLKSNEHKKSYLISKTEVYRCVQCIHMQYNYTKDCIMASSATTISLIVVAELAMTFTIVYCE